MSVRLAEAIDIATRLCKTFEGLSLKPYICPAGYPTIGYGTVNKPDGTKVTMDHPPITKEIAEEWLVGELVSTYMAGVLRASPVLASKPRALGAITDFAYNLGVPRYRSSTLRRRVEAEDWDGAQEELLKWNRAGGRILTGLVRRRQAECQFLN